ncbi:Isoleucine--tRNA ligase [Candidatus Hodgkinia cicadicola]|uniref:Isoleucine--tRNA ligase n=1 Tax=Candidatus Hodgkinia cicadicola TaxID=573658 RepID=A0ABX4MHB3_9HYPH|nr:Isoleucine--tRNA ligase [Candidatus Hodgkinia cicadicola]
MFSINLPKKQNNTIDVRYVCYQLGNKKLNLVGIVNRKRFGVLDGPPFANGELHLGHMVNKILKDVCFKAYEALGLASSLKYNWDCHGLPIELQVLSRTKNQRCLSFICKIYSLNWAITQALQLKMFGIHCYKPRTTLLYKAQRIINERIYYLVKTGMIFFGKKYSAWSVTENSSISDIDISKSMVNSLEGNVCSVISRRRQMKITSTPTLLELLISSFKIDNFRMLGIKIQFKRSMIWSLPWGLYVDIPVYGLGLRNVGQELTLSSIESNPNQTGLQALIPAEIVATLNVFNVFNLRNMPVIVGFDDKATIVDTTYESNRFVSFAGSKRTFLTYNNKYFNKGTIGIEKSLSKGEKHVINKLIACSLIQGYNKVNRQCFESIRSKSLVINCVSPQWYIKIDHNVKEVLKRVVNHVKFRPWWYKELMMKLICTRSDWIISRQRVWGIPICLIMGRSNKIIYDSVLFSRLEALLKNKVGSCWSKIRILYNGYNKLNWLKVNDVLDVWFDAGMVYKLRGWQLPWDVAIEGVDQHRGWFQTLLIISVILKDKIPVKLLITHPFVVNINLEKMSKSIGGVLVNDVINEDHNVSRCWASGFGLSDNRVIEDNWSLKMTETLYKIDSLIKWSIGVLENKIEMTPKLLQQIDRFILHKLFIWNDKIRYFYDNYLFYDVLNLIESVCNEISSNYFELSKRILYCSFKCSVKRENRIFVIGCWVIQMCKWLNPILPTQYKHVFDKIKVDNYVIWRLPTNWFSFKVGLQFKIVNAIREVIDELMTGGELTGNMLVITTIIVGDINKLKLFKNISSHDISERIKLNIIFSKKRDKNVDIDVCEMISIKISIDVGNLCCRCRGLMS